MSKEGGNGVAGASAMQYSEFLQNVHSAWLTGINPYDGYYGTGANPISEADARDQGLIGRLRARMYTGGTAWNTEFGGETPYPNVANAVKKRIGEPMPVHQVLPGETSTSDPVMNPYLKALGTKPETYEINEGLFFDPDSALPKAAAGSLWSNVSERMPNYNAILLAMKNLVGHDTTPARKLIAYFNAYATLQWVNKPVSAFQLATTSNLVADDLSVRVAGEFPDATGEDAPLGTSTHATDLTLSGFPALALLDVASVITDVPTELSAYDTDDLIAEHMSAKSTRSIEEMATTLSRITAGMEDIRAVMNTQFIGALAQLESSRIARLDEMETELKTRAMQIRLQHAHTYSGEQRSYQQAKDQFTLASADWKVNRAAQYAQAQRLLDDALDRWEQVKADWLIQRAVQKGAFDMNLATAKDQFDMNRGAFYIQAEGASIQNTLAIQSAVLDYFIKLAESERASFLQAYDLIRLRMGLELDTTMHNVEVVRRAFTWELETFQYPMNYIASIGGSALQQRAPNWGERMLATLSSAASAGFNVAAMTGNPVLGAIAGAVTLGAGALTGRG